MAAPEQESTSSVVVSLISDVGIAIVKIVVAIISGSSAMLSEAIHSSVDSLNSVFLLVGVRLSRRPADDDHPFGHGREVYFWTLIVAVSIFAGGGALSCYEGISHLRQPAPLGRVWPSYVVLAVAGALLLAVVLLGVDRTLSQEHAAWYLFDGARMPRLTCSRSSRPRC
ncbi:MAG: cation diffusion facilitator family transporter [Deltaproteobacteria bacterium]